MYVLYKKNQCCALPFLKIWSSIGNSEKKREKRLHFIVKLIWCKADDGINLPFKYVLSEMLSELRKTFFPLNTT